MFEVESEKKIHFCIGRVKRNSVMVLEESDLQDQSAMVYNSTVISTMFSRMHRGSNTASAILSGCVHWYDYLLTV